MSLLHLFFSQSITATCAFINQVFMPGCQVSLDRVATIDWAFLASPALLLCVALISDYLPPLSSSFFLSFSSTHSCTQLLHILRHSTHARAELRQLNVWVLFFWCCVFACRHRAHGVDQSERDPSPASANQNCVRFSICAFAVNFKQISKVCLFIQYESGGNYNYCSKIMYVRYTFIHCILIILLIFHKYKKHYLHQYLVISLLKKHSYLYYHN